MCRDSLVLAHWSHGCWCQIVTRCECEPTSALCSPYWSSSPPVIPHLSINEHDACGVTTTIHGQQSTLPPSCRKHRGDPGPLVASFPLRKVELGHPVQN